jgi:DNA repair exonuclease SbcCD nuclease subunit
MAKSTMFTFVHTADWQIGKGFRQFAADAAAQLRAARLNAIDRVADVAIDVSAAHVLVAGDVFDSELVVDTVLRQALARMANYARLNWHLLPGNHDPARGGGLWERLSRLGVPSNVMLHTAFVPCRLAEGVTLLPAPLFTKQMASDPTAWMDQADCPDGDIRIGLAHGSVRGFGSLGEAAVPIDAERRRTARLDYLALGDWHGMKEIGEGVWYSGTPEPDGFTDNQPGNVLVVSIEGRDAPPRVVPVKTGYYRWLDRRLILSGAADIAPVEAEIAGLAGDGQRCVIRLSLEGTIGAAAAAELEQKTAALAAYPMAMRIDDRRLMIVAAKADGALVDDALLSAVADRLIARGETGEEADRRIAARAMQLLIAFEAEAARREGSA